MLKPKFIQFQVVQSDARHHVLYGLDEAGQIWSSIANSCGVEAVEWRKVEITRDELNAIQEARDAAG